MYPWYNKDYTNLLLQKKEFYDNRKESGTCLKNYQKIVANYINPISPYNSIFLYMNVGTGKTLASIAIAENFIKTTSMNVIVVTKNSDLVRNYITELLTVCSTYTTKEEVEKFSNSPPSSRAEYIKSWIPRISRYIFRHHEEFKRSCTNGTIKNLSNKVIIIDEIHKMIGNRGYGILLNVLKESVNYRLVVLSATPMFDSIIDIFQLSNLLNAKQTDKHFPIEESQLIKEGYIQKNEDIENVSMFKDNDSIVSCTEKGLKSISDAMSKQVIYVKSDPDDFPKLIDMGEHITLDGYTSDIKLIKCEMDPYQEERYIKLYEILKSKKDFNRNLEHASNMIYPDKDNNIYIGSAGYVEYVFSKKDTSIFKEDKIYTYSTKLYNLLQNIKISKGKVCIFSSYVNDNGIAIISEMLYRNNITSFISLSGSNTLEQRRLMIDKFNQVENDDGSLYKILIFSSVLSEGITLKSVREMHIFEPLWNLSSIDQIIGRVYRSGSHSRLPLEERTVKVFRYCNVPKDMKSSIDLSKYIKAGRKDYYIKQVERQIGKTSVFCNYTIQHNSKYSKSYQDGSRECEYNSCEYTCEPQVTVDENSVDYSTYDSYYHNREQYNSLQKKLVDILKSENYISIDRLAKLAGSDPEEVKKAMAHVIKQKISDTSASGDFYKTNLKEKEQIKPLANVENTKKIRITNDMKIFIGDSLGKSCMSFKKDELLSFFRLSGFEPPDMYTKKEKLCSLLYEHLNGIPSNYVKPEPKKIEKQDGIRITDDMKIIIGNSRGKMCSSFTKDEILGMFKSLGFGDQPRQFTKDVLCKLLAQKIKELNST